jgi:hypothetical protein
MAKQKRSGVGADTNPWSSAHKADQGKTKVANYMKPQPSAPGEIKAGAATGVGREQSAERQKGRHER